MKTQNLNAPVTLKLEINVTYDLNGTDPKQLIDRLHDCAKLLAAEGLMSGHFNAEVDAWDSRVTIIED